MKLADPVLSEFERGLLWGAAMAAVLPKFRALGVTPTPEQIATACELAASRSGPAHRDAFVRSARALESRPWPGTVLP